jgi:hypothetical protein
MKTIVILVLLVLAVGQAVVVGSRLPVDAVTVIIGVGCRYWRPFLPAP